MKAMILAAGEGRRMRPLTEYTPKPLLKVQGKSLIEHHIERLKRAGFTELVINISYLGDQIERALGDGSEYGVQIQFSKEDEPLETAGGILQALPLLGAEPFMLINGDVWTDFPIDTLNSFNLDGLAHLVLIPNPCHNSEGDFCLNASGVVSLNEGERLTYSGISVLSPEIISSYSACEKKFPLIGPLIEAISKGRVSGECYAGEWLDVGTPERLASIQDQ